MLVSIIIPAFRAHGTISRTLQSLLAQTLPHWEGIIVSDDGTDYATTTQSAGIQDARLRFMTSGGIQTGCHRARNAGLAAAQGQMILHCDADDISHPQRLERLLPEAEKHGAAVDTPAVIDDTTGALLYHAFKKQTANHLDIAAILNTNVPLFPLIRREHAAPRLEGIEHAEDVVANLRLVDQLGHVIRIPDTLFHYHVVKGSMSANDESFTQFELSYASLIKRLIDGDGLHLSPTSRNAALEGLKRKRAFNQTFGKARTQEPGLTFQVFAARYAQTT